jgi:hypothetical protein
MGARRHRTRPDEKWYAAGDWANGSGGALYVDNGSGWSPMGGAAGYPALKFTTLGFDERGKLWLGGNYPVGDSLEGKLFVLESGALHSVTVARKTGGIFQIYGIGFDAEGHGWIAGGRSGISRSWPGTPEGPGPSPSHASRTKRTRE